jgi:hypothetical protein
MEHAGREKERQKKPLYCVFILYALCKERSKKTELLEEKKETTD